ncbi:GntR family transcriptional regulator [Rhodoferax sp.]|uniref:GntR family transcriptional regulator n=1 Tax=Rhodoferax sp. TaxID=50421 RepID=UPI0025EC130D|nr:GntR family transcriptional regulator [Rhodoferax sp.]MCM2340524.1 GntR family transcriptional regulator [Rhodoferax sp.]
MIASPAKTVKKTPAQATGVATSLTARVTEQIREAIQNGEFKLGEGLSELKLAAALGVSRTPVREAFNALQLQGLIDIRPQSGSFVFMPTEENVGALCEFRRVMEVTALRLCFEYRREDALQQMRVASDAMELARQTGDRLAISHADTDFHQAIMNHCNNPYLIEAYKLVSGRVATLRTHNLVGLDTLLNKSISEHRLIIAALSAGKLDRAETILDEHISRMGVGYRAANRHQKKSIS